LLDVFEQKFSYLESVIEHLQERNIQINGHSHNVNNLDYDALSNPLMELVYSSSTSE
jgi:hypothetical protein